VSLFPIATPAFPLYAETHCPRCGQAIQVAELEGPHPPISRPVEQQIICPECAGFIATVTSAKMVFAYRAAPRKFGYGVGGMCYLQ
jgi:hypothetical protein